MYNYVYTIIYTSRWYRYVRNYVRMVCHGGDHSKNVMLLYLKHVRNSRQPGSSGLRGAQPKVLQASGCGWCENRRNAECSLVITMYIIQTYTNKITNIGNMQMICMPEHEVCWPVVLVVLVVSIWKGKSRLFFSTPWLLTSSSTRHGCDAFHPTTRWRSRATTCMGQCQGKRHDTASLHL